MAEIDIRVHEFKRIDLADGVLVVSVPSPSIGNILLTDFLLEDRRMDQVAALDSEAFPPVAMLHAGKARFLVRIHADPETRVAVLRSEFPPEARLARPLARAILDWAAQHKMARVVALDAVAAPPGSGPERARPPVQFVAAQPNTKGRPTSADLERLERGAIGGVPAMLLLEARLRPADAVALLAILSRPLDDLRSVLSFAHALPAFVPGLRVDPAALERRLEEIQDSIRSLQEQAQRTVTRLQQPEPAAGAPSMFQ